MNGLKRRTLLLSVVVVVLVCLAVYARTLFCGFVNADDPDYVLNNPLIRELNWNTVVSSFTRSHVGWWMPLTWISFAIDYRVWGLNPFGYHLTNILLHGANAGLVVLIADRLWRSCPALADTGRARGAMYPVFLVLAGLLFGIHPLRVESVAWISERKDVLNGFFSFGAIFFYLRFAQARDLEGKSGSGREYLLAVACFLLSLMAKSVSVVLPLVLLLLDWYPLGRLRKGTLWGILLEKVPFLVGSVVMAFCTVLFAFQSEYLVSYEVFPLGQRLLVSGNAIWEYCRMLLIPAGLSPFHVIPDPIPTSYLLTSILVACLLAGVALGRRPCLQTATLCFLLPLLPVLAFLQNGDQSFADRFTYVPSLAPSVGAAALLAYFAGRQERGRRRAVVMLVPVMVVAIFLVVSIRLMPVWDSPETYWTRVINVQPLAISYKERGRYYHSVGRYGEAIADFTAALERVPDTLKPYEYNFHALRAESLRRAGRYGEAVAGFTAAIAMVSHPAYYYHRGLALKALGRVAEADEDFRRSGPDPGPVVWIEQ